MAVFPPPDGKREYWGDGENRKIRDFANIFMIVPNLQLRNISQ